MMNAKKLLLAVACCALFASTISQAKAPKPAVQQIVPDTLADLKAEYEYQEKQLAPYVKLYVEAEQKKDACVHEIFNDPLGHIGCRSQDYEIMAVKRMAEPIAAKYNAARDAYEREQRKADRSK